MKLIGNLLNIKTKREDKNKNIELYFDQIEYVTAKRDGHYTQEFSFVEDLEQPLILTGDCLARTTNKDLEENEYEFDVYDKVGDEYVLNPDKYLSVLLINDVDLDEPILTSVYYTITVSPVELREIEAKKTKEQKFKNRKGKKKR
ncbi:MAG: hypothetical protein LPK19_06095 [Hymenobacteraceae bacterium]|nr:hypothetical protein [Hymenobacteraceae bacterium]MDX5395770.1 hypothetical protein [Hymenobacteraceae bacterium]MDX5511825.1 hypothetical protein [Hymenobacteraceae bacterium]